MILLISSCSKDEDQIVSQDLFSPTRFEFPQGSNPWDIEIAEIQDEFGLTLIYKEFTGSDLNKTWVSASGAVYYGNTLNDDQAEFYVNFLKDNVLHYLDKELVKEIKPQYFYLVDSLHNTYGEWIINHEIKTNGLDFWAISFLPEVVESIDNNVQSVIKKRRITTIYPFIEKAIRKGFIQEPVDFKNGIDYTTAVKYNSYDSDDMNYFINRGFVHSVYPDFSTYVPNYSISSLTKEYEDFLQYIRISLLLTEDEIHSLYPQNEYPLVNTRYELVVNYLKDNYNIDLKAISEGN